MRKHCNRAIEQLAPGTACFFVLQFPVNLKLPLTQLAKAQGTAGIHSGCANRDLRHSVYDKGSPGPPIAGCAPLPRVKTQANNP